MSKLRSVSTAFWSDPFIEDLNANEKLLFLYLITNDKTNMLGVFEVSIKKMSYDTGLKNIEIENALKGFERLSKVKYVNNHIILVNFLKNQKFNLNMKKSALTTYENLPKELKVKDLKIDLTKVELSFETLCKAFGMVRKIEVEVETKFELETKEEIDIITPTATFSFFNSLIDLGIEKQLVNDWLKVRKTKKATNTETAFNNLKLEFNKCGKPINEIINKCVVESWGGFKSNWEWGTQNNNNNNKTIQDEQLTEIARLARIGQLD